MIVVNEKKQTAVYLMIVKKWLFFSEVINSYLKIAGSASLRFFYLTTHHPPGRSLRIGID